MEEKLVRLLEWSHHHGGALHDDVEIYDDTVTRLSLRVKKNAASGLHPGDTVVLCPFSTSLSYLSACGSSFLLCPDGRAPKEAAFPDAFLQSTPPHVVGRFFLIQQYLLGPESFWHPYIATLPQPGAYSEWALPAVWEAEDAVDRDSITAAAGHALALLNGTNAGASAAEMRKNMHSEYQQAAAALATALPTLASGSASSASPAMTAASYTASLYAWAYCIFTSRSFRPSLVMPEPLCQAASDDDFSILLPLLDLANHDPQAKVAWVPSALPAHGTLDGPTAHVAFQTGQAYVKGQQVFNNYGLKTNVELLLGYGFVLPPTPALHNDYVHLRRRSVQNETNGREEASSSAGASATTDYLLSLRPIDDASSLVGRARQWRTAGTRLRPDMAQFEDALLWDLCTRLWTADEQVQLQAVAVDASVMVDAQRGAVLTQILGTSAAADHSGPYAALAERVHQTLLAKVGMDYERLVEMDPYEEGDDDEEAEVVAEGDKLICLAETYREQIRRVLINALTALDPELEVVEGS